MALGLFLASAAFTNSVHAQATKETPVVSIIPRPLEVKQAAGAFRITPATRIIVDPQNPELKSLASMLATHLKGFQYKLSVLEKSKAEGESNAIVLTLSSNLGNLGKEGYKLSVQPQRMVAKATDPQGIFYALQSVYQLLPPDPSTASVINIPAMEVSDQPRFGWRGMMLDVGRHFYPVDFVKKFIDYLAMYKMNSFHWHLTEDQGWRIEIKKYPKLTQVGAWREGTLIGAYTRDNQKFDGMRYGGFYTQEQVREIVAYAKARYINVVPEIEMPGHSSAALTAYPSLGCTGGPYQVQQKWGVFEDVYCAGNEETFAFLQDVLSEVVELFPSKIIHIGGDECPKARWKACSKCQARMKKEGLKDEHELQSYFIKRIENYLLTKGRNIIGWDEILEGGLAPKAAVMSWRGIKGGIAAAKQHHEVVMSPNSHLYFDHYQGQRTLEPHAIGGFTTLEKVYSYEPVPAELSPEEARYIKGAQANLWTEYIPTIQKAEYMIMPRMAALAEVVWTKPQLKDWNDFTRRMRDEYRRYEARGINYSKSAFNVLSSVEVDSVAQKAKVSLKVLTEPAQIYYTVDGSEPTPQSALFTTPFEVDKPLQVKAASFLEGKQIGKTVSQPVDFSRKTEKK